MQGGYLLTGMARCGVCNGGIEAHTRPHGNERVAFYACARAQRSRPHGECSADRRSSRARDQ